MFQVVGWAEVQMSTDGEEEYIGEHGADWLQRQLEKMKPGLGNYSDLIGTNGSLFFRIAMIANRENGHFEDIRSLLVELGERAPGTYGVFHTTDYAVDTGFQCLVMRRGVVEIMPDPFFSPIMPTIEDPFT